MPKHPIRFKDLMKLLKPYGVRVAQGGKGSETILRRYLSEPSEKGPQFTMKTHGKNPEIDWRIIERLLARFDIPETVVWKE